MAPGFWSLAKASFSSDAIKPRSRELAILGLLSIINAPYVVYSHRLIARALGLSDQQYDKGLTGATPEGLDEEESMAYKLGRILADLKGPMNDDAWNEAVGKMGKKAVLAVTHIIGGYFYIAMLTNINGRDKRFE
jgi:4-carboxymuconolactone decarboxylase